MTETMFNGREDSQIVWIAFCFLKLAEIQFRSLSSIISLQNMTIVTTLVKISWQGYKVNWEGQTNRGGVLCHPPCTKRLLEAPSVREDKIY